MFVSDVDRCYRLKLFLEQFGVKCCILNSELPLNSRVHVVEEFNKNVYEIVLATDEHQKLAVQTEVQKPKINSQEVETGQLLKVNRPLSKTFHIGTYLASISS